MVFLCGSALYRAGAGWHRNTIYKKRRFASRAQTLNAHCCVRFASFAAFEKWVQYTALGGQQPQYQAERTGCAGYGLVTKFTSGIANAGDQNRKKKHNYGGFGLLWPIKWPSVGRRTPLRRMSTNVASSSPRGKISF